MQKYKMNKVDAGCPVCGAVHARLMWSVSCHEAAQHFVLKELEPEKFAALSAYIAVLWGKNTCDVVCCDECRFCYSFPYVAGDAQFYTLAYDRSEYPGWKWEYQLTYDALDKAAMSQVRLLEIGAGNGAFIKKIVGHLVPGEQICCTEFSEYGRQEIEKLGVTCYATDVRNLDGEQFEHTFDVICMFQVLEHMDKLDNLFLKLNAMLKSSGSLFVAVPNPLRIEFNEKNGALLDMPPNHIGRWNMDSFRVIAGRYGFDIEDIRLEPTVYIPMMKQFVNYRFMRNSQRAGSFENRTLTTNSRYIRKAMRLIALAVNIIMSVPALVKMQGDMGNSLWVHFKKSKELQGKTSE